MASYNAPVPDDENAQKCENQVPEWILASQGIKLIINNNTEEAKKLFLRYPDSLIMFAGYSFAIFMDALMSFEEDKLSTSISVLKEVEKRCATENGWLRHVTNKVFGSADPKPQRSLAEQLETQIILADSQVCIAILTFLQQDISGYFKGGWVLRKAWKVYQRVYKEILHLYKEHIGELSLPDTAHISINTQQSSSVSSSPSDWDIPTARINGYTQHPKIPHSKSATLYRTLNGSESAHPTPSNSPPKDASHRSATVSAVSNHRNNTATFKKSTSISGGLTNHTRNRWGFTLGPFNNSFSFYNLPSPLNLFSSPDVIKDSKIDTATIERLMGAVSFGYGLFQLGISLLPPSLSKLTNILGFGANRQDGLSCLMYARLGRDMRAPLATLSLLWYHTIVRPFYAIDGTNVQAGVDTSTVLLRESQVEFKDSALFLFFRGRVCRLNSDIKSALVAFQQAVENTIQREIKILCLHEIGWCHLIELDYCSAESTFDYLKSSSRWSKSFYAYLAAICAGACEINLSFCLFEDLRNGIIGVPKGTQLEEFLSRRAKCCPTSAEEMKKKTPVYWRLLVFEMLYLWNALPSCSRENTQKIVRDCNEVTDDENDEPMKGLSKLILGCAYCIQGMYEEGLLNFRKCLEARKGIAYNVEDAHVSAFALYELGALLIRTEETREEGKSLLQRVAQYSKYDFQNKLDVRVYSLLRSV
ncbi:hypothetical protein NQ318_004882 [Aromia moschata]|uniref:Tetratricopeptide repeat protein 39C n=1 Tax=Aromia moschata TaxID=1265417 RepID=A0AAV8Z0R5_9CUCU|nr:hypothetical protein NQ318_004882 [Aromia moschata]